MRYFLHYVKYSKGYYALYGHTYSRRVRINRVRLPILHVVSSTGKLNISLSAFSRLRVWSRETGSAVASRVSLFISILRLNLVLTYGIPPEFRGGVYPIDLRYLHNTSTFQCSVYSGGLRGARYWSIRSNFKRDLYCVVYCIDK